MVNGIGILVSDSTLDLSEYGIWGLTSHEFCKMEFEKAPAVAALHFTDDNSAPLLEKVDSLGLGNNIQFIALSTELSDETLHKVISKLNPMGWTQPLQREELVRLYQEAFATYFANSQDENLSLLLKEKNEELKRLGGKLEKLVDQRQRDLEESTQRYIRAEKNLLLLQKTLTSIYDATTVSEIEQSISKVLQPEKHIDQVKIRLKHQSNWSFSDDRLQTFAIPIALGSKEIGELVFAHDGNVKNTGDNKKFFRQVAEAVGLSIEKSIRKRQEQEMGKQWESTFDAISYPIALTDAGFNILQTNKAYRNLVKTTSKEGQRLKCYQSFFGRDKPCEDCRRKTRFNVTANDNSQSLFQVSSAQFHSPYGLQYIHSYKDITQSLNLERQQIEQAKMVELGTVSSSIAHELNNPIGGMLNFIQLIQMDLKGNEPYKEDLKALEQGTRKCKSIVQNLLGFARQSDGESSDSVNLKGVIEQACKIVELKTRSRGIVIEKDFPESDIFVLGRFNLLSQGLLCLLQNSQDSLIAERLENPGFKGKIQLKIHITKKKIHLKVTDNGGGIPAESQEDIFRPLHTTKDAQKHSGLGLTLARQIFEEQGGQLNLVSADPGRTTFEIQLDPSEVES